MDMTLLKGSSIYQEPASNIPKTKSTFVRPWESSQPDTHSTSQSVTTSQSDVPIISQARIPNAQAPTQFFQQAHIALLKEFQIAPRPTLASALWIDALLHSYNLQFNSLGTTNSTKNLQLINQTRQVLQTYIKMSCTAANVYVPAMAAAVMDPTLNVDRMSKPYFNPVITKPSLPSPPQTSVQVPFNSPDAGYISQSPNVSLEEPAQSPPLHKAEASQQANTAPGGSVKSPLPVAMSAHSMPPTTGHASMDSSLNNRLHGSFPYFPHPITGGASYQPPPQHQPTAAATLQHSIQPGSTKFLAPCSRFILEDWYQENLSSPYVSDAIADDLAVHAGISRPQVLKWMSNRRNRDGNTKKTVGRRRKTEYNRAKPYTPRGAPQARLSF